MSKEPRVHIDIQLSVEEKEWVERFREQLGRKIGFELSYRQMLLHLLRRWEGG